MIVTVIMNTYFLTEEETPTLTATTLMTVIVFICLNLFKPLEVTLPVLFKSLVLPGTPWYNYDNTLNGKNGELEQLAAILYPVMSRIGRHSC